MEGTAIRPRLRSRKNLGCCAGGDTQGVLYLVASQPELCRDYVDRFPRSEEVDDLVQAGASSGKPGPAELVVGIDCYLGNTILREMDYLRITVGREVHAPQVAIHDLGEHPLVVADNHQLPSRLALWGIPGMLRIVVQDLRAVGVQAFAGQGMLKAQLAT
jgi:hypothetical protein